MVIISLLLAAGVATVVELQGKASETKALSPEPQQTAIDNKKGKQQQFDPGQRLEIDDEPAKDEETIYDEPAKDKETVKNDVSGELYASGKDEVPSEKQMPEPPSGPLPPPKSAPAPVPDWPQPTNN